MVLLSLSRDVGPSGISLIISLAFGLGQCGIGTLMVLRGARLGGWRSFRPLVLALVGAGFALSGLAELVVSGAETLASVSGAPDPAQVSQLRLIADDVLAAGLVAAAVALALYPVWRRFVPARGSNDRPAKGPL